MEVHSRGNCNELWQWLEKKFLHSSANLSARELKLLVSSTCLLPMIDEMDSASLATSGLSSIWNMNDVRQRIQITYTRSHLANLRRVASVTMTTNFFGGYDWWLSFRRESFEWFPSNIVAIFPLEWLHPAEFGGGGSSCKGRFWSGGHTTATWGFSSFHFYPPVTGKRWRHYA